MVDKAQKFNNFFLLHYEDLCDKPKQTLTALSPKIGIRSEKLLRAVGQVSGVTNNKTPVIKNFNFESIGRLSKDDKLQIRAEASEMLDYFGYTPKLER